MKKLNITIIFLLALALIFTACRSEAREDTTSPPDETILDETTECLHTEYDATENAPTCTESAKVEYFCLSCGYYWSKILPATGHNLVTKEITATCADAEAKVESHCTKCDYTSVTFINPPAHNFVNNICTYCGAREFESEGLEFRTFADHAVLIGIGTCKDKDVVIPAHVDGLPVTEIGERAFVAVAGLRSVRIPEGVRYIESEAFLNCADLSAIYLPASLENITGSISLGFMNCAALKVIELAEENAKYFAKNNCLIENTTGKLVLGGGKCEIPADGSVKSIGAHAFAGNSLLETIVIPEGVSDIYTSAFEGCANLASVSLPKTLVTIRQSAFKGCISVSSIVIPDSVTEIYNGAFSDCKNLKNVTLSADLSMIDSEAFKGCAIESIQIPSEVRELGAVFAECVNLKSVILPEGFERFSGHTFAGCTSLESINLPESLQYLGFYTFFECSALKELTFGGTVAEWNAIYKQENWNDGAAFTAVVCSDGIVKLFADANDSGSVGLEYKIDGEHAVLIGIGNCTDKNIVIAPIFGGFTVTTIEPFAFYNCQFIESVVIPEGVTIIGDEAFYLCKNLKKVTLPSTLDIVGSWAFANCESLESIAIPDQVLIIESRAFSDCIKLSQLTLGKNLQSIEENAFMNCTSLASVAVPAKVVYFGNSAFSGCTSLESVTFKKGIEMIGSQVFSGCIKLTSVKYTGKIADWERIGIAFDWMQGSLIEKVVCSDGDARLKDEFDGTPGLSYGVSKDGKNAFLAGIGAFEGTEIVVASEYNGLPVTSIAYRVINNAPNLTSIHISKNVTSLPSELFYKCDKVIKLTVDPENPVYRSEGNCIIERASGKLVFGCNGSVIPANVKIIGESAFASSASLKSLILPEGIEVIETRAFSDCSALASITLPESLISIGEFAFYNCSSLESISFGAKVERIDSYAFSTCTGLVSIYLPDSVTLGDGIFYNCSSLKSVKIPAAQTSLCGTFYGCSSLENVILPENLTELLGGTFCGCVSLKSISLPASVKIINGGDFADCVSLTDFSYGGTVAEWNSIYKQYWKEGAAFTLVKCADGTAFADAVDENQAIEIARGYWNNIIRVGDYIGIKRMPTAEEPYFSVILARNDGSGRYPIEAEIFISRDTGEITLPDYSYPDISAPIMSVLTNQKTLVFVNSDGKNEGFFKDVFLWGSSFGAATEELFYCVCDLDSDGKNEVILSVDGDIIILREYEGKIYGYEYPNNEISVLFSDGSYSWKKNAGIMQYTSMIVFDGADAKCVEILCNDRRLNKYYIEGVEVTKAEYDAREAQFSKEKIEFSPFYLYPMEVYAPN